MRRLLIVALCAAVAVGVAACGSSNGGSSSSAGAGTAAGSSTTTAGKKHVTVEVLEPTLKAEFFQRAQKGMQEAAAEDQNATVHITAASDFTRTDEQVAKLQAIIAKRPDAIAINLGAPAQQAPMLQRALDSGIKVVTWDKAPGLHGDYHYVLPNQLHTGRLAGDFVRRSLPHGGTMGIITCQPGFAAIDQRVEGVRDALKGSGVREVSYLRGDCDLAKGLAAAQNMLVANPDIDAIVTINGTMGLGAAQAAKGAHKHPIIVTIDGTWAEADAILAGDIAAAVSQIPEGQGKAGVAAAIALARGERVPTVIDPPGVSLITRANAAQYTRQATG